LLRFRRRVANFPPFSLELVTISLADDTFQQLADGKLNGQKAFMSGKLKVKGNIMLATKLDTVLKVRTPFLSSLTIHSTYIMPVSSTGCSSQALDYPLSFFCDTSPLCLFYFSSCLNPKSSAINRISSTLHPTLFLSVRSSQKSEKIDTFFAM